MLQYLGDLQSGSRGSLSGARLLQTFPLNTCPASMLTVQRPVSPHSLVWWSLTCLVIPRETQREAVFLSWSAWSCSEACFSLGCWHQLLLPQQKRSRSGWELITPASVFSSKVPWGNFNHFSCSLLVFSFESCCSGWQCCFFPTEAPLIFFFPTTLNFLSHSRLEISSEFGSECDWINLCYCQHFFRG